MPIPAGSRSRGGCGAINVRIVRNNGLSVPLNEVFPSPDAADSSPIHAIAVSKAGPRTKPTHTGEVPVPEQA